MQEVAPGIWHWTARHPRIGMDVSSYLLGDMGVLLDPLAPADVIRRLEELGPPREILLTNRHHWRSCEELVDEFGCTVRAPRVGMHEFPDRDVEPYDFGDELAGGAITVYEVGSICPDESALHIPSLNALAVADGVINYGGLRFVPDNLMDAPEDTKRGLSDAYARLAHELDFDHLLTAHGPPVIGGAQQDLERFAHDGGGSDG